VRPSAKGPFPVINSPDQNVDAGQRFFFPVHGDLAPGKYMIRVDLEEGPGGSLELSRLLPGSYDEREFREEVLLHNVSYAR
jgi:hypothetical protein